MSGVVAARSVLEVADIFRRHLDGYRHNHALTMGQERAARALVPWEDLRPRTV